MNTRFIAQIAIIGWLASSMTAPSIADDAVIWSLSGSWAVTYGKSAMDDSPSVFLSTRSNELIPGQLDNAAPAGVQIVCQEHKTAVLLTFNDSFMSSVGNYGHIEYRIDQKQAQVANLAATSDNSALWLTGSQAIHFIQGLFETDQILVRAMSFEGIVIDATFPTKGLETAIKPLRKACGW